MANLDYYLIAGAASKQITGHPGLEKLQWLCRRAKRILDVGCGEGSRLNTLLGPKQVGSGIDVSRYAITKAKGLYPRHHFRTYSGQKLPYKDGEFDLVYSAFVLEHTTDPKLFVDEMVRVTSPKGLTVFLCPNFGAPNRRSPNSVEVPGSKLLRGLRSDFVPSPFHWTMVRPKDTYEQIDDDTTTEPYVLSLVRYLTGLKLTPVEASSLWPLEPASINPRKMLFKYLGLLNIFPFKYWGPQLFIVARK